MLFDGKNLFHGLVINSNNAQRKPIMLKTNKTEKIKDKIELYFCLYRNIYLLKFFDK